MLAALAAAIVEDAPQQNAGALAVTLTRPISMSRLRVGIIRYASVISRVVQELGIQPAPDCQILAGRMTLTLRRLGASAWPADRQAEYALRVAATARAVLIDDPRADVRKRADRAIVVVFEDTAVVRGCAVVARWECVVPAAAHRDG